MPRHASSALLPLLAAACATAAQGPTFEYAPTGEPLRYDFTSTGTTWVQIPGGEQRSEVTTSGRVRIEIGPAVEGGHALTAAFERFSASVQGDFQNASSDGAEIVGRAFGGVLRPDGSIRVEDGPSLEGPLERQVDPVDVLATLFPPLPPPETGPDGTWPIERLQESEAGMRMTTASAGTATFAGDTTWNARSVRIISSRATVSTEATGTPPGAPGEIDMILEGESRSRYLWDPAAGVLVAATSETESDGDVLGAGFAVPIRSVNRGETRLVGP